MLPAPSPHARNAPAPAPTQFRGPESRPPRGLLNLAHKKETLRPGPRPRQHTSLQALRMPCMASTMRLFCVIVNRPLGAFSRPCAATRRWAHAALRIFSRHDHTCPCHGGHSTRGTTSWTGTFLPSWGRTAPLKFPVQWPKFASRGRTRPQESSRRAFVAERRQAIGQADGVAGGVGVHRELILPKASRTVQVALAGSPSSSPAITSVRGLVPVPRWSGEREAPCHGKGTYPV
jgi:hypothetical protein